jgi:hypothetical protein
MNKKNINKLLIVLVFFVLSFIPLLCFASEIQNNFDLYVSIIQESTDDEAGLFFHLEKIFTLIERREPLDAVDDLFLLAQFIEEHTNIESKVKKKIKHYIYHRISNEARLFDQTYSAQRASALSARLIDTIRNVQFLRWQLFVKALCAPLGCVLLLSFFVGSYLKKGETNVLLSKRCSSHNKGFFLLVFLTLLFLLVKNRMHFIEMFLVNAEYLMSGNLAKDLLTGLHGEVFRYRVMDYHNNIMFLGFFLVPFFTLFGDSCFSLFLASLFLQAATLFLILFFSMKHFGKLSAVVAGFLFVFAPPQYVFLSLQSVGTHADVSLFGVLSFLILYEILFRKDMRAAYLTRETERGVNLELCVFSCLLGFVLGFSLWVCFTSLVSLLTVFLVLVIFAHRFFCTRYCCFFAVGFLCGFSPLLVQIFYYGSDVFRLIVFGDPTEQFSLFRFFCVKGFQAFQTIEFMIFTLIHFFQWIDARNFVLKVGMFGVVVCAVFVPLIQFVARISTRSFKQVPSFEWNLHNDIVKKMPIVLFVLILCVGYCFYPILWPDPIYLTPIVPFLFILVGGLVSQCAKDMRARVCAVSLIALLGWISVGYYAALPPKKVDELQKLYQVKGYTGQAPFQNESICWQSFITSDSVRLPYILTLVLENKEYQKLLWSYPYRYCPEKSYLSLDSMDYPLDIFGALALGSTCGDGLMPSNFAGLAEKLNSSLSNRMQHYFYEGIALSVCRRHISEVLALFESDLIDTTIPHNYRHYFYLELGRAIAVSGKKSFSEKMRLIDMCAQKSDSFILPLYWGFWGNALRAELFLLRSNKTFMESIDEEMKKLFFLSLGQSVIDIKDKYFRDGRVLDTMYEQIEGVPPAYRNDFLKGFALSFYWGVGYEKQKIFLFADSRMQHALNEFKLLKLKEELLPSLFEGLGCAYGMDSFGFFENPVTEMLERIPERYQRNWIDGYKAGLSFRYGYDSDIPLAIEKQFFPEL